MKPWIAAVLFAAVLACLWMLAFHSLGIGARAGTGSAPPPQPPKLAEPDTSWVDPQAWQKNYPVWRPDD